MSTARMERNRLLDEAAMARVEGMTLDEQITRWAELNAHLCREDAFDRPHSTPLLDEEGNPKIGRSGHPIMFPDWQSLYPAGAYNRVADEQPSEAREKARAYLERITGRGWEEAEAMCREYIAIENHWKLARAALHAYSDSLLVSPANPTGREEQERGSFRVYMLRFVMRERRKPTRAETEAIFRQAHDAYPALNPTRIRLR